MPEKFRPESEKQKIITLPDRDEMLKRLLKVSDDSHMQERFYPILLKKAGQKQVALGVVNMLALAIHDYTEGLPPVMTTMMYMQVPEFIDALVDDPEAAKEAKGFLQEALSATKQSRSERE